MRARETLVAMSCKQSPMRLMGTEAFTTGVDLHRGNDIPRPRDRTPKIAFRPETVSLLLRDPVVTKPSESKK